MMKVFGRLAHSTGLLMAKSWTEVMFLELQDFLVLEPSSITEAARLPQMKRLPSAACSGAVALSSRQGSETGGSVSSQQEAEFCWLLSNLICRLRELSTATDQVPVDGRFGFSDNPGPPTGLLSEGCAIYLRPQYLLLGYESDRFARCDSACRNPINFVSPQTPSPHCCNSSHWAPKICT